MEKSASIANIARSLIEFQKKVGKIKKDSTNPFLNKKYASLSNILDQISTPLSDAGLVISQFPTGDTGLISILMHGESGEFIQESCEIKNIKEDPQVRGSHISYLRRYALCAMLSLNIDDEPGQTGTPPVNGQQAKQAANQLPWLNHGPEYDKVVKEMAAGATIQQIKERYKLSKATEEALKVAVDKVKGEVLAEIHAKVFAVKSMQELTALYNEMKAQVDASDDIKGIFQKKRNDLQKVSA